MKLTTLEVLNSFPDEIPQIVPGEIKRLEKSLEPLRLLIASYYKMDYEPWIKDFYAQTATILSGKENDIQRLKELKILLFMHNNRNKKKSFDAITDERIMLAKSFPIKDMYSFEKLKAYGSKLKCSCPFHTDNTPSFYIYPSNTFHCFSCSKGGSNIDFYMQLNNMNFKQAVLALTS